MIVERLLFFVACFLLSFSGTKAWGVDQDFVVNKLRLYCKACHAVGDLKFITSDKNQDVWNYLWEEESPRSGRLWGELIIEVMDWPSDLPPPPDELMDPPDRDWMPKGNKRNLLANDYFEHQSVRRLLLDYLSN